MALNLSTLFTRLGHHAGGLNEENTAVGSTLTTRANTVFADYTSTDQPLVDQLYSNRDAARSSFDQMKAWWQSMSSQTLIQMELDGTVYAVPDLLTALGILRLEMIAQASTLAAPTLTQVNTPGSGNIGNGFYESSIYLVGDATQNDYVIAETITFTCTADGYAGGSTTQGQEIFTYSGQAQQPNLAWNWPGGSGASGTITVSDPLIDDVISNACFNDWPVALSPPTGWTVNVGTLGTTVVRGSSAYRGSYALTFVGNGSELTAVRQVVTGLLPNTAYSAGLVTKSDGAVAAGAIKGRLINADTGSAINDDSGVALDISFNCSVLTSSFLSYQPSKNVWITPNILPTNIAIEIKATTAITNTEVITFGAFEIALANELYVGGPYFNLFAGSTPFAVGDTQSLAITNNRTAATFVSYCDNIFDLRTNRIKLPSGGSPTIANALIT